MFPGITGGSVMLISLLALAGWAFDIDFLRRVLHNSVAMNPLTATAFILAAASLRLSKKNRRAALACAGLVAAIGLARLLDYWTAWDIGIDRILFSAKLGTAEQSLPNRMAPNTALNFSCIGFALLFLGNKSDRLARLSQGLLVFVILNAFVGFLGHLYDAPNLYRPTPFIGMAVHTAACFMLISLGILAADSDRGIAAIVANPHVGGNLARRLLPAAFLIPTVIGSIRLWGERAGFYDAGVGVGIMVLFSVIPLTAVLLKTADSLNQTDAERRLSEQRLAHALDISGSAVVSVDQEQRIVYFDGRAEKIFGHAARDILGRPLEELLPARFAQSHRRHVQDFSASPETARLMGQRRDVFGRRKDGSEFPIEAAISKSSQNGAALFTAVIRDITERKKAEQEVLRSERLVAANKELEAFSYSVSHDLRAPLRHIDGFIELLGKHSAPSLDEQGRRYLATIADSARRMGMLIDDLLSFSRMAREEMRMAKVDLSALATEAIKDLKPDADGRRIAWKIAELPEAECDPSMLRLVFVNLIGNAIKFTRTREEAVIEVGAADKPGRFVVFVRDNGVGFDMQYAHKLFGIFQRLHRQEEFEGTGIGLANIRRIIHRHGGETWAESEPGKGASFFFSLPRLQEMKS